MMTMFRMKAAPLVRIQTIKLSHLCYNLWTAPVAQLDRASDFESVGRGFESLRAHLILGPHSSHEWQVPILLRIVEPVPDDKSILYDEPTVVDRHFAFRSSWFLQQDANVQRRRLSGLQILEQKLHGESGIDDVFDKEKVPTSHWCRHIVCDAHLTCRFVAFQVR